MLNIDEAQVIYDYRDINFSRPGKHHYQVAFHLDGTWGYSLVPLTVINGGRGAKKRGVVVYASSLWGTAEGAADLKGSLLYWFRHMVVAGLCLIRLGWQAIVFAEPASQVNQATAGTAKWPIRPVLRPTLHCAVAYWAVYLYHRKLTCRTSMISSPLSQPALPVQLLRLSGPFLSAQRR